MWKLAAYWCFSLFATCASPLVLAEDVVIIPKGVPKTSAKKVNNHQDVLKPKLMAAKAAAKQGVKKQEKMDAVTPSKIISKKKQVPKQKIETPPKVPKKEGKKSVKQQPIVERTPRKRLSSTAKEHLAKTYESIPKLPVFIINLDGSTNRMVNMKDRLDNKSHLYGSACRVPAVDFRNCTSKFQYVQAPFWEKNSKGGLLASGMSHRRAWEIIVLRKIKFAIIMEDDVNHYAAQFDELYAKVASSNASWDVFRFSQMYFHMDWINSTHVPRRYHDECHYMTVYKHFMNEVGLRPKPWWGFGGAMYGISYEGAKKGLANFNPLIDIIDSFAWADKVQCYLPAVVTADFEIDEKSTRKDEQNLFSLRGDTQKKFDTFLDELKTEEEKPGDPLYGEEMIREITLPTSSSLVQTEYNERSYPYNEPYNGNISEYTQNIFRSYNFFPRDNAIYM